MRVLMLAAVVCFVVAVLAEIGTLTGTDALAWAFGGWLAWALDVALGGWTFAAPGWRRIPPQ